MTYPSPRIPHILPLSILLLPLRRVLLLSTIAAPIALLGAQTHYSALGTLSLVHYRFLLCCNRCISALTLL